MRLRRSSLFLMCNLLGLSPASAAAQTSTPTFEVATVKAAAPDADPKTGHWSFPNIGSFTASHVTLGLLIQLAYDIDASQIANQPGWLDSNLYDVTAKPEEGIKLSREELRPRLQELLRQRFHLVVHTETRHVRGFALNVAKGGPHLKPTTGEHFPGWKTNVSAGSMRGVNWSMPILAQYLTSAAGFPVVDQTGLSGSYDVSFSYENDPNKPDSSLQPLAEALKQATGLLLRPQLVPVMMIAIDSVDKTPAEN